MRKAYQIEMLIAAAGILAIVVFLLPIQTTLTGYVPEENATTHSQNIDLTVDGSKSYTLTAMDGKSLHLSSFTLDGAVSGGRAEILLDNREGQQLMVYENIGKKPKKIHRITGTTIEVEEKGEKGVWLIIQPSEPSNTIKHEFLPLQEDEELIEGIFNNACVETCSIPRGLFNASSYKLIFRLEEGTTVDLYRIDYILHEEK